MLSFDRKDIKFFYRGTNLPENIIILSAKLQANVGDKNLIKEKKKFSQKKKIHNQVKLKPVEVLLKIQKTKKLGN